MKSRLRALFPLFFFLTLSVSHAQQAPDFVCGFDDLRTPSKESGIQWFEEQLRLHIAQKDKLGSSHKDLSGVPYIVPVVVHIIHDGGTENILDAQILAAIDHLNEGFAAQGYYAQQGAMINTQIQFCLAKRDPDGNATTGITRTQSPLTNMIMETEDIPTKDLSRWNPKDYVNIWVVKEISSLSLGAGVAGYAYFPSSHGGPEDGMICEARFFGKSPADDAVLIHEMGHYFGLYHTFEGGCQNNDCSINGDRVCDTPPDNATHTGCNYNSCSTDVVVGSPFISDVDDYTNDFMDYSPLSCYAIFTAGQSTRMQAAIEIARKSLLNSKGCLDPCTQPLTAAFSAFPNPVFAGQSVLFTNNSTGATNFSWSENGLEFSQVQNPSQIFNIVGNYLIALKVTNSDPNCEDTAQAVVQVQCPIVADFSVLNYEIEPGETLVFINTSTGGATGYEWSINGLSLAMTTDFFYLFTNPGYYSINLQATGPACGKGKTVQIHVKSPCGDPFVAATTFRIGQSSILPEDMVGLPDGSMLLCGRNAQKPMISRLDAVGNVLWHKVLDLTGTFNDIEPLADGSFALRGQASGRFLLAKIDDGGNILWFRTLQNPEGFVNAEAGINTIAANPDGSFAFFFRGTGDGSVGKMSANGTVDWIRKFQILASTGGLERATDGSGDYLISTISAIFGLEYVVIRINQAGDLVKIYKYGIPQQNITGTTLGFLGVHPDGDFSLLFEGNQGSPVILGDKYMIRCQPNGQPRFAKKLATVGHKSDNLRARYMPGEGWLLSDSKVNADNYLIRINEQNEVIWQRKFGTGGFFGDGVIAAFKQNGLIRALKYISNVQSYQLLQLPDVYFPIPCLPDIPKEELVTAIPVQKTEPTTVVTPQALLFAPEPFAFLDAPLSRTPSCSVVLPCPEFCDNGLDDDEDGLVDCFDTDCDCFDSDTFCLVDPPVNNFAAKLDWQSSVNEASVSSVPMVANLNPQQDSIPEILIIPSSSAISTVNTFRLLIFNGDGSNASNPNVLDIPQGLDGYPAVHPTVADLDGNGVPEVIIVTKDSKIRVFTDFDPNANPCMKLWTVSVQNAANGNTRAFVADFDGDGVGEIFSGNRVFKLDLTNPSAPILSQVLVGNGARGLLGWAASEPAESSTAADLLSPSDCNGDPDCDGLEIAAGFHIYSIDIDLSDGDGYQIKVQRDLNILDANHSHTDGYTSVADLDLDGTPEIIVSGRRDNTSGLYVWNKNGLVQNFTHPTYNQVYGMVCVANVFDDKTAGFAQDFPELIACHTPGMLCLNLQKAQATPAQPFWWKLPTIDGSGLTGATVFDFNGDGLSEIVYRDEQNLRIMYGGAAPFPPGVGVERNWYKTVAGSGTFDEYPVVADVDNDGEAEIAVTSYLFSGTNNPPADYRGRLRVFESANFPWLPARPLWNQFNYFGVNINDDLTVPKTQQKHWLEMGGVGSGKRPLNAHLAQPHSLNPLNINKLQSPDADIAIDSTHCKTDSFDLFLNICNLGSAHLPSGTPIAFYNGNPTTSAATLLFPPVLVNEAIEKGACKNIKLSIPATYNTTIFAVVNDDGTVPSPFNLTANFPSTSQPECQFANNMASFSVQNQTPILDLGTDISLCKNSVVELTASPNFQKYRWQDGSTASTFTAYSHGKYWVDAFDACGFRQTDTINILLNTIATLDLPDEWTICEGDPVVLTASGFSKYTWFPADSVSCSDCASVHVLATKSITIHLTAAEGDCFVSDSVRINLKQKPSLQLLAQDGDCIIPASITTLVFGNGPFEFLWSNLSTDSVLNTSQSGTYAVSITDQDGCQTYDSASVATVNSLDILASSAAPICSNSQTGSIDLTLSGGTAPFQFLWSNNATTEDLSNTSEGTYIVMATDANGCTATISETLSDPAAMVLGLQITGPKCAGEATGGLDLTASGGTGTLTFFWSNSSSNQDLSNLQSGTYSVLTTDANGCTATISETLTDPPAIVLDLQITDPKCVGEATGALDLTASGGTGTLTFSWSNSSSDQDLSNLQSGTFSVLTTDANGCTATISETLTDPPAIVLDLQITAPLCAGQATGALDLSASGGTGTLTFFWSNTSNLQDISNLQSGTYSVLTTDANGCTATISETLTDPPAIVLNLLKTDPLCAGEATGVLDLTTSGGTGSLTFFWSNSSSDQDLSNLQSGTYSVLATDVNGCTAAISETLTDPPAILSDLQKTDLNCPGDSGMIDLTTEGGLPPFTFEWSNGETSEDINISQSGTYTVTVKDSNACTFSVSTVITTLGVPPILNLTTDTLTCQKTNGVISVSSHLPNTSFLWSGAVGFSSALSSPTISTPGTFTVIATEPSGGCTSAASVFVPLDTTAPTVLISSNYWEIPCSQDSLSISAAGSSSGANFSIQWTTTSGGLILSGEQTLFPTIGGSGFYDILIINLSNGCTASDAVEVFQLDNPTGTVTADSVRCFGETNGAIRVISNIGGIPPFMYSIDNQNFTDGPVFENLAAGNYPVTLLDANGCVFMTEIEIGQPAPIAVELTGDSLVVPGAMANLQALVNPINIALTQISWLSNGIVIVNDQLQQSGLLLQNTLFQINIADSKGCSASDTWLVRIEESRKIYVPNVIFPENPGGSNQTFLIFAGLGVHEIEYLNIFDRWGNQLFSNKNFQANDESQGWNGTFRGQLVEPGIFVWVAKVIFKDGTVEVLKGDLTVVR